MPASIRPSSSGWPIPTSRPWSSKSRRSAPIDVTLALVTKRKWLIIDERPPQLPRRIGRIEAVARTRSWDSVKMFDPHHPTARDCVDIRSSSRYFEGDLGSNAARVSKLIDDINTAVDNANPAGTKKPRYRPRFRPRTSRSDG